MYFPKTLQAGAAPASRLLFAILCLGLLGVCTSRLVYPFDVGQFEAAVWAPALESIAGRNPYAYALREPYIMAPYGYLYYLLVGVGLKLFGYQFWLGRLLAVVGALCCVRACLRIVLSLTDGRREAAWFTAAMIAAAGPFQIWLAVQRSDFIGLAFAFGGLAIAVLAARNASPQSDRRALGMAFLFTAAFLCKLTLVLPTVAAIAWLLHQGRRREAVVLGASYALLVAAAAGALNVTSSGGYGWQHLVLTRKIPVDYAVASRSFLFLAITPPLLCGVACGVGALYRFSIAAARARQPRLAALRYWSALEFFAAYGLLALVVNFISSARAGANVNYYLESLFALGIVSGLAYDRFRIGPRARIALAALLLLFGAVHCARSARGEYFRWAALPYFRELVRTVKDRTAPDAVLLSAYPELAVAAGRPYYFGDFMQYTDGRSRELVQLFQSTVEARRFGAILWHIPEDRSLRGHSQTTTPLPVPTKARVAYLYLPEPEARRAPRSNLATPGSPAN